MFEFILICFFLWVLAKLSTSEEKRNHKEIEDLHKMEQALLKLPQTYRQNTTEFIRQDDKRKVVNYIAYLFGVLFTNYREFDYNDVREVIATAASNSLGGYRITNYNDEIYVKTMFELGQRGMLNDLDAAFKHLFMMKLVNVCDPGKIVIAMSMTLGGMFAIDNDSSRHLELSLKFLALVCVKLGCRYEVAVEIVKKEAINAGMYVNFQAIKENQIQEACNKLGISRNTTREEFRRIKRNKLAQWHPDKAPAGQEQYYTSKYQEINGWCELVESQWK